VEHVKTYTNESFQQTASLNGLTFGYCFVFHQIVLPQRPQQPNKSPTQSVESVSMTTESTLPLSASASVSTSDHTSVKSTSVSPRQQLPSTTGEMLNPSQNAQSTKYTINPRDLNTNRSQRDEKEADVSGSDVGEGTFFLSL
jgi:cytoskeletal protein RodZ